MWNNINLEGNITVFKPDKNSDIIYNKIFQDYKDSTNIDILDLGCGSGAIGLALAKNIPTSNVIGLDINQDAIDDAKNNAEQNNISNINFYKSDMFENIPAEMKFDVIVAYIPYINFKTALTRKINKDICLTSYIVGNDSDEKILLKKLIIQGKQYLKNNGRIYFKVKNANQMWDIHNLLKENSYIEEELFSGEEEEVTLMVKASL